MSGFRTSARRRLRHSARGTTPRLSSRRPAPVSSLASPPCHDNAPTESLFGSLKTECVRGERFETHNEGRAALFDYPAFYNHRRRHSAPGYRSPAEHECRHYEQQAMRRAA